MIKNSRGLVGVGIFFVSIVGAFFINPSVSLAQGTLIHEYTFNDGTLKDSVGTANGTLNGTAAIANGSLFLSGGNAGASDATLPASIMSGLTSATFEGWFTLNADANWSSIFFGGNSANSSYIQYVPFVWWTSWQSILDFQISGVSGGRDVTPDWTNVGVNTPTYFAAVYDATTNTESLYFGSVGGTLKPVASLSMNGKNLSNIAFQNFFLGRGLLGSDINGQIDEFRVYNGALTSAQINADFLAGPTPTPPVTTAVKANDFLNSIGVATHIAQGVDNPSQVSTSVTYAGIRNIRDDGTTNPATIQAWLGVHASSSAKFDLLPVNGNIAASISEYEQLNAAGALLAAEGPNEPNNFPVTYQGQKSSATTSLPIAKFQRDLYAAVKADPKLAGIPVFASSEAGGSEPDNVGLQFLTIPANSGVTLMPIGTQYADYANTHNYVTGNSSILANNQAWFAEDPTLNGAWDGLYVEYGHTWWSPGYNGYTIPQLFTLPRVTTETGWITQGTHAITEDQQGKLFLNLFLDAFKRGWTYTFIYMLHDDPVQGYWGLFHTDYTPKLSATYLHNLTTILGDTSSAFTPGVVNYSIPNEPATVHDMLLQKSSGMFELAVWDEQATGSTTVTVNLDAANPDAIYGLVNLYDPTISASPVQTFGNVNAVPLSLSDHPLILEFSTLAPAPRVTLDTSSTTAQTVTFDYANLPQNSQIVFVNNTSGQTVSGYTTLVSAGGSMSSTTVSTAGITPYGAYHLKAQDAVGTYLAQSATFYLADPNNSGGDGL